MSTNEATSDIVVKELTKAFQSPKGRLETIDNISFNVGRGETVCIIGPSGCGKSTILRIIAGLETKDTGEVLLPDPERSKHLAYLHQFPVLLPWRTVLQNASLGAEIRRDVDSGDKSRVLKNLDRFGLLDFSNYMPDQLSGGMKQRLSIIRALTSAPEILLCDEPFSSIDYLARFELNTQFKNICSENEITCIFVTHNIEEAIFLADSLIVLSSRPCRQIKSYRDELPKNKENALSCRQSQEFEPLFRKIWEDLKH
jgi:NitT/TauT family transport system ATP-binding protein